MPNGFSGYRSVHRDCRILQRKALAITQKGSVTTKKLFWSILVISLLVVLLAGACSTTPKLKPATFVVSNLIVEPNTLRLTNFGTVSCVVANIGDLPGTYTAVLKVETAQTGQRVTIIPSDTQAVTLASGENTTVSFNISIMGNGTHIVSIDGLWERLTVDSQI